MEEECGITEIGCNLGKLANSALGDAIQSMASAVMEAFGKVVASLGTVWVNIGTPDLTGAGASSSAISAGQSAPDTARQLTLVMGYVTWISLAMAILSIMALGAMIAVKMRRGEGAAAVGKLGLILGSVVLISAASALVAGLTPSGPTNAGGAVLFLQSGLWWYMGAAAVLSVIIGGARMAWEQRADPGRDTVKGLLTLIVVAGAGVTIIGILIAAADSFSVWLINGALGCDVVKEQCFGVGLANLLALGTPVAAGLGPLLIIILGLIAILASFLQILLMVARGGMLVILAGILPLSASFTNTEMGKQWFRKAIAWTVAFILYKPAAAIVYASAFQLVGTGSTVFRDDGSGLLAALTGLMLMVIALFAMPALMRFVTPMVGAMAGGSGGAMAVGALAAVPTGAAAGRVASGSTGGSGSAGAAGSQGSSPTGGSDSGGSTKAAPRGGGASGAADSAGAAGAGAPSVGAAAGGSAGAAGAAGSAGGRAAAGGAAAAGGGVAAAGAGPVGVAASAAAQAGQAAAGAAQSLGEQSTSDGGGPDGGG